MGCTHTALLHEETGDLISVAKELISEHSDRTAFDRIFNKSILWPSLGSERDHSRREKEDEPRDILKRETRI